MGGATNRLVGPPNPTLSPGQRRAVRGKFCGRTREEIGRITSSWPGLTRPSTPSRGRGKGVDARIKSAQDDLGMIGESTTRCSCKKSFPGQPCFSGGEESDRDTVSYALSDLGPLTNGLPRR